ncbi:hypothetical protein CLV90_0670 [Maribacter spongiicola]|uniref:DUF6265 domain-containing protein n=1 Tax=Maribacter spongiicola TaxID=1206753 RepID=A0A4R7K5V0_9FLAO|nr:DUF6265 family protein [Maribacter spongiicola]TDT46615.1 hypothetical protein CLV90_0670 [Maribacter spongiicola]
MKFLLLFLLSSTCLLQAQNTVSFEEGMMSPAATLNNIEWLAGHWKGEAFGGIAEEIWSPPADGSMMFSFRLLDKGEVSFYEFGHLIEIDGTLMLQLKHFDANLSGWEERDENIEFRLVKIEENKFYFDDLTIERISDKEINMYVEVGEEDGTSNEVTFNYHRQ